jgi:hypothetical protein
MCELYAELLRCSNMSLLDCVAGSGLTYDSNGCIVGGTLTIHLLRNWVVELDRMSARIAPNGGNLRRTRHSVTPSSAPAARRCSRTTPPNDLVA